jgi:hypothetical protein
MYKIEDIGQNIGQVAIFDNNSAVLSVSRMHGEIVADLWRDCSSVSLIIHQYRPSFSECRFFGFREYWQAIFLMPY